MARTQADIVMGRMMDLEKPKEEVRRVRTPGIEVLHERPINEIAEVLATVLKSASNVVRVEYVIGSHIELTIQN